MKDQIHPKMNKIIARCACGTEYEVLSTLDEMKMDVCGACHPFYQGKGDAMIIDTEGRIDKFRKKFGDSYLGK